MRLRLIVFAVAFIGAACNSSQSGTAPINPDATGSDVRLPLYAAGSDTPDAQTSGIITILGKCVWIERGPDPVLPIWPDDTTFDASDEAVIVGGTRYRVGDRVHLGGGLIPLDLPMVTVQPPHSCGADEGWIVSSIEQG